MWLAGYEQSGYSYVGYLGKSAWTITHKLYNDTKFLGFVVKKPLLE